MIPLPAEVREFLQRSIRLTSYILIQLIDLLYKRLILYANKEICCSFKSFAGGTFGYSYREDRRCISQVVPLRSCKKRHFKLLAEIQKLKLILFCREPASSRRQKISMILQFALLIDQISVLVWGGFVVSLVDIDSKYLLGNWPACTTDSTQDVWKIHITWLFTTLCKITRPVRLRSRLGIGQQATKNPDRGGVFYINV